MSNSHDSENQVEVLHVGKYFPPDPGGMETYLRDLMVCSLKLGTRSAALVHSAQRTWRSTNERYSSGEHVLAVTRSASWFRVLFTPISPTFPWVLTRLIQKRQPKILHLHLPNPSSFWALLLPPARRLPWVVHWQSDALTPHSGQLIRWCYRLYKPFESALLRHATKIIVTSDKYLNTSVTLAPFVDKCAVIPLGIEDRFGARSQNPQPTLDVNTPLKVISVGRLAHYKGFDMLLHAISQTQKVELDLIGQGKQLNSLKTLCQQLALTKRVRFHGKVSDDERDALLLQSDCLCLPSTDRTESFGIVLLEAMSAGKPCVVTDVHGSGMTTVVKAGQTGLVVPCGDRTGLAAALGRLADNRESLVELGTQGRERFVRTFTVQRSTQAILALYAHILRVPAPAAISGQ